MFWNVETENIARYKDSLSNFLLWGFFLFVFCQLLVSFTSNSALLSLEFFLYAFGKENNQNNICKKVNIKQLSMFSEASSFDWMLTVKISEKLKSYFTLHWSGCRWVDAVFTSWKFNSYTKLRQYLHCIGMWEHVFEWLLRLRQKELAGWYEARSVFVNGYMEYMLYIWN